MQKPDILANAKKRIEHFSKALLWYSDALNRDEVFKNQFILLARDLVECDRAKKENRQVFFIAVGKSAHVAQLMVSMLVSVGILARFVHPTEAFHGDLGVVGKKDTVVLISNNGRSSELIQLLPGLAEREVTIFTITAKDDSPLAQKARHLLLIPPFEESCPLTQAPLTSTVTTLALCQLLVAATVELRSYPIEEYAKNHPGGAIGKRIFLKIEDLMIKKEDLPCVSSDDSFKKVVSIFTQHSKGAVLVVEKHKFLGLISEKDLRIAMEQGPEVFSLKASQFMNATPTFIAPQLLAIEALRVMSKHTPVFNLLPVVDAAGKAVGMIRMLDLVSAGVTL